MTVTAPDRAARDAIRDRLDANLFVEAGAGSGKTSSLVDRVVALVQAGRPISAVAAITFTERSAEELRDRVRSKLERHAAASDEHCRCALDELDRAAIGTLHAFAQRLLLHAPIEAGLPPRIDVLDEIRSEVAFDERWRAFRDRVLDDPDLERTLVLLLAAGGKLTQLRELARAANASWDLVEVRLADAAAPEPPALACTAVLEAARAACRLRAHCTDDGDKLCRVLDRLDDWRERLAGADELAAVELLVAGPPKAGSSGRRANWPGTGAEAVRDGVRTVADRAAEAVRALIEATLTRLVVEIARFTLDAAQERRREGRIEFHDLLVLAKAMLRDPQHGAGVRAALRAQYQYLLLDEFQDTDPIQIDLAVLLATSVGDVAGRAWTELPAGPGRLFVVGDPKQSIYRFRRADVATFLEAQARLVADGDRIALSTNFRSTPEIVGWVNSVFGRLIQPVEGAQPPYLPLAAARPPTPDGAGPSVALLGVDALDGSDTADTTRAAEAGGVVAAIQTAIGDAWQVADRHDDAEQWRPARYCDICVLLPARTSLGALEDALHAAAIPYRTETASLVYSTREVRDLLMVLRAIDDPTDQAALVAALRTPWLGCGDDDLLEYRHAYHGRWNVHAPRPEGLPDDHPVARGLEFLGSLHDARQWATASELLDRLVRERRVMELAFATPRPRELWRRVRFVVDQARAYEDAAGGDLRDFLHWTALQSAEGARVVESVLPETDDDAVRIMTVHAAKGLQFPIVILSGMSTRPRSPSGVLLRFPDQQPFVARLTKSVTSAGYEEQVALDEQMDHHERLRLLYVACTRAQDHVVVSVQRAGAPNDDPVRRTSAELLWDATRDVDGWVALAPGADPDREPARQERGGRPGAPRARRGAPGGVSPPPPFAQWQARHSELVSPERARRVLSASGLARAAAEAAGHLTHEVEDDDGRVEVVVDDPALHKEPRDLELPPWMKGRYGTAVGRAVHAVLQTIDLATGAGLAAAAGAQAAAEGVLGFEDRVERLVRAALASPTVAEAVAGRFWREVYVATPGRDGLVLEGYVDLLYERRSGHEGGRGDGLVVVDYKTDAVGTEADVDTKLDHYRAQGAAYALAVARATGRQVVECAFLFLTERGAIRRVLPDLDAAVEEVARQLS